MRSYIISDTMDTLLGFRLAGVQGMIVQDKDELLKVLNEKIKDPEIGIIILTDKIKALADEEIMEMKLQLIHTLIVEIPSLGSEFSETAITQYIRDSIGIKID